MKLIIDIPETEYQMFTVASNHGIGNTAMERILDGKPLDNVLDKIMDEVCDIDDDIVFYPDSLECKAYVRLIKVMDIIDKYRGESKDADIN